MKGKILVTLQFVLLGLLAAAPGSTNRSPFSIWLSVISATIGITLLIKSFRDLGAALTPLPESKEGAELVTSGIYKYIRHPIYSALMLIATGVIIWKWSLASLVIAIALLLLLFYKARYEDSLLRIKFLDAEYYQESTPAFLPIKRGNYRK